MATRLLNLWKIGRLRESRKLARAPPLQSTSSSWQPSSTQRLEHTRPKLTSAVMLAGLHSPGQSRTIRSENIARRSRRTQRPRYDAIC